MQLYYTDIGCNVKKLHCEWEPSIAHFTTCAINENLLYHSHCCIKKCWHKWAYTRTYAHTHKAIIININIILSFTAHTTYIPLTINKSNGMLLAIFVTVLSIWCILNERTLTACMQRVSYKRSKWFELILFALCYSNDLFTYCIRVMVNWRSSKSKLISLYTLVAGLNSQYITQHENTTGVLPFQITNWLTHTHTIQSIIQFICTDMKLILVKLIWFLSSVKTHFEIRVQKLVISYLYSEYENWYAFKPSSLKLYCSFGIVSLFKWREFKLIQSIIYFNI